MRKTKLIHYNCSYEKYRSYKSKRFNGVLKPDILGRTNEYHGTMDQTLMMTPASINEYFDNVYSCRWLGHILRLGPDSITYQALKVQHQLNAEGNLLIRDKWTPPPYKH